MVFWGAGDGDVVGSVVFEVVVVAMVTARCCTCTQCLLVLMAVQVIALCKYLWTSIFLPVLKGCTLIVSVCLPVLTLQH